MTVELNKLFFFVKYYSDTFENRFSFEITRHGEILRVFHPADEDEEVLSIKKGFAAMLSGKLHKQEEVSSL